MVMITHDMHLMLEYTPRALVFCDGQLIATAALLPCCVTLNSLSRLR